MNSLLSQLSTPKQCDAQLEDYKNFCKFVYEPDDIVEIRLLGKDLAPIKRWIEASELSGMYSQLRSYNDQGYNIYFGINPRIQSGKSGDSNVKFARHLFADFDGIEPMDGCGMLNVAQDLIYMANAPNPSMYIFSGHGIHAYWKLATPLRDLAHWKKMQGRMAEIVKSDRTIKNPERIMRIPGFKNVKRKPYTDCFVL